MREEQIYNPMSGINQMISDIVDFVNPIVFKLQPIMRVMGIVNLYLVIIAFAALLIYLVCVRKHKIGSKLKESNTYIFAAVMLAIYVFLSKTPIRLGPSMSINLGLFVMPIFAKKKGPLLACFFGAIQYMAMFAVHSGEAFSLTTLLLASISGMLYGRFLYAQRTTYIRCLFTKLIVNMVCNVIFVPMVIANSMTMELANAITMNIVSNVALAPLQALVIYLAFIAIKKVQAVLSDD